jgi:hypothetical protein
MYTNVSTTLGSTAVNINAVSYIRFARSDNQFNMDIAMQPIADYIISRGWNFVNGYCDVGTAF